MDSRGIINILNNNGNSIGTGFFASPNGYIVTCYHVLKEANSISIDSQILFKFIASQTIHFATLGAIDEEKDIAILHSDLTPVVHYAVKIGGKRDERLATLGFPNGDKIGIPADPVLQDYIESGKYIQLKEANTISHGFSGAPLVTEAGLAVGMIAWIPRDDNSRMENIAHAIPSQLIIDAFSVYLGNVENSHTNVISVDVVFNKAVKLFRASNTSEEAAGSISQVVALANNFFEPALLFLAYVYRFGEKVDKDYARSNEYINTAAKRLEHRLFGYEWLQKGKTLWRDGNREYEAISYLTAVAELPMIEDEITASACLFAGKILLQQNSVFNPSRAASYLQKAMMFGKKEGQFGYACLLYEGNGIEKDADTAERLMFELASVGHKQASRWLEQH